MEKKSSRKKAGAKKAKAGEPKALKAKPVRVLTPEQAEALALSDAIKVREKPAKPKAKAKAKAPASTTKDEKPPEEPKLGRPSTYRAEIADEIIRRLSNGEPLRQICRDEHMPHWTTVYDWKDANEEFSLRFVRARDIGHDAIAEDTISLIDETPERTMTEFGDKVDPGFVQWQKNRVEQRLKLLSKWNPKKYGDKVDLNHGGQENNPVQVATKVVIVPQKQRAEVITKPLEKQPD